jgi:hypothetical protein
MDSKHHFLASAQFFFDPLDDNIQVLSFMDKIEVVAADGQDRA